MMRSLFILLLALAVPLGNALVVHPLFAHWLVSLCDDADLERPLSIRQLNPQHPLHVAKEPQQRVLQSARAEGMSQPPWASRSALRPFLLALDWPLLVERMAATSLLRLEVRLQI